MKFPCLISSLRRRHCFAMCPCQNYWRQLIKIIRDWWQCFMPPLFYMAWHGQLKEPVGDNWNKDWSPNWDTTALDIDYDNMWWGGWYGTEKTAGLKIQLGWSTGGTRGLPQRDCFTWMLVGWMRKWGGLHIFIALIDTQSDSIQCLNFADNWFNSIFDSILVSENSIQTIIQFKINSSDSIQ